MYNKDFEQLINMCMLQNQANKIKEYQTYYTNSQTPWASKPYTATNMVKVQSSECAEPPAPQVPLEGKGYIEVGVFTALGALPVPNANVTIYKINNNEESVFTYLKTGANGQAAVVEVPVTYDSSNPNIDPEYFYTNYNVKISADGFNTEQIFNVQVFPDMKTLIRVSLTPASSDSKSDKDTEYILIPPQNLSINANGGDDR